MSRYNIARGIIPEGEAKKEETKVFERDGRINFVDTNNVFVGYDMSQSCCENADWFFSDTVRTSVSENLLNGALGKNQTTDGLEGFTFDPEFFKEIDSPDFTDGGGMVVFRLVRGHEEKFLHLFNCHNGYYAHGFEMKIGDKEIKSGSI